MKKIKNNILLAALSLSMSLSLFSFSGWTDVEGLNINQANIEEQNPELYAQYLQSLKEYKVSHHKILYVTFDNSVKTPINRAQHISVLPDSIDVISLMYPDNLSKMEQSEISEVRTNKGTKFVFTVNYDALKLYYETVLNDPKKIIDPQNLTEDKFVTFLNDTLNKSLKLVDKYNYDGLSIAYNGKATTHLTEAELKLYTDRQTAFIGAVADWKKSHENKILFFEGKPQNLLDKSILTLCSNIILPSFDATTESKLMYNILQAKVEGVPTDKFIISVTTRSLSPEDIKTGYWADGNTPSINAVAIWSSAIYNDFTVAGLGINNVSNDYFNAGFIYKSTRFAIQVMNPSIKK